MNGYPLFHPFISLQRPGTKYCGQTADELIHPFPRELADEPAVTSIAQISAFAIGELELHFLPGMTEESSATAARKGCNLQIDA
jgi:hypothetical protein